jgi:aminopeptidase C
MIEILLQVCLVTDPRPSNPYGHLYTVDCLGNMVGGRTTIYNNQPVELLAKVAADSIKANEAVWFGCEVIKRYAGKSGLLDLEVYVKTGIVLNNGLINFLKARLEELARRGRLFGLKQS